VNDEEWKVLSELRPIDDYISGQGYSLDFAQRNKMDSMERIEGLRRVNCKTICIIEPMEIMRDENGCIMWRRGKNLQNEEYPKEFYTQFGKYCSYNQGEFGGALKNPNSSICGNFVDVFDYNGRVYAVDSLEHLSSRHFVLYELFRDGTFQRVYSVGDIGDWILGAEMQEDLLYEEKYMSDALYILISGYIKSSDWTNWRWESRILKISSGVLQEVYVLPQIFEYVSGLIIQENMAYIAMDKMLAMVDLLTCETNFYTFLSKEELINLEKANKR